MALAVRDFDGSDRDYEAVARIGNASVPDEPVNIEMLKHWDSTWDARYMSRRMICERDGEPVASVRVAESQWAYVPGKYLLWLYVLPEFRRQGVGTFAYDHVINELSKRELPPTAMIASAREDVTEGVAFLEKRGYELTMREQKSRLMLDDFAASDFESTDERLAAGGIAVRSLAELMAEDPDWTTKMWDLTWAIEQDIPWIDPPTRISFEKYVKYMNTPAFLPEAAFVALDGEEWVGLSMVWKILSEPDKLYTELTGVLRSHRRKGIATALKVRCIRWAVENGYVRIDTDNEEKNPMYTLNVRLGFKPLPAWLRYRNVFDRSG
ncbi:MAG: GNAT family N-acetyltransferase [Candidatus Eisenbacteria bacterium]|nr:GNAT family N-acetyltransferase [Candidatus Eisenbacteria bacterium]